MRRAGPARIRPPPRRPGRRHGGPPPQETPAKQAHWEQVINQEYNRLLHDLEAGHDTLLDPYGAENEAEFFAVASECFYERPRELQQEHPDLYAILRDFYKVEPAEWGAYSA